MPDPLRPLPEAPIDEDLAHERRQAVAGRVGRGALRLVVGLALLGVFGGAGPLVCTEAVSSPGTSAPREALRARYDRFARLDAPTVLAVALPPGDSVFVVGGALADDLRLDAVLPTPTSEARSPDGGLRITAGSASATVQLHVRPLRAGRISGLVALPDGRAVRVRLFVCP